MKVHGPTKHADGIHSLGAFIYMGKNLLELAYRKFRGLPPMLLIFHEDSGNVMRVLFEAQNLSDKMKIAAKCKELQHSRVTFSLLGVIDLPDKECLIYTLSYEGRPKESSIMEVTGEVFREWRPFSTEENIEMLKAALQS